MGSRGVSWLACVMCVHLLASYTLAGDLWVDSSQGSDGDGSFGNPYKRITIAMVNATSGDTIKVIKEVGSSVSHLSCWDIDRNEVYENLGAGIEGDWGEVNGAGSGYLNFDTDSNLFVKNGIGIHLHSGEQANGSAAFVNDTVAGNSSYGLQLDDLGGGSLRAIVNSIMYFNNPTGSYVQQGGNDDLDLVIIENNNWQLLDPLGDNIDEDPLFVNMAGRDYHLDEDSPCIDAGDDTPRGGVDVGEYDFDSDDRQQDVHPNDALVDIGADEFTPE